MDWHANELSNTQFTPKTLIYIGWRRRHFNDFIYRVAQKK